MNGRLLEGSGRLLGGMSEQASVRALKYLNKMGVEVKLNSIVQSYDGRTVTLKDGTVFKASTLIWAAGVTGNMLDGLKADSMHRGRLKVNEFNKALGYDNVYAIGDISAMVSDENPNGHPMLAPVAIQQGKLLAANLKRIALREALKPFQYFNKGTMATVGRNRAVVDFPAPLARIKFGGFIAWLAWMFVHLMYINSFRNKLVTFLNWTWSYLTYDKGTRLIIRPYKHKEAINQAELKEA
jgi:NADH dehydrogenase